MQRPGRVFLTRRTCDGGPDLYELVWKEGHALKRINAGTSAEGLADFCSSFPTQSDAAPTTESIVRDLRVEASQRMRDFAFEAWDVTDTVGTYHPRIRRGEFIAGQPQWQRNVSVDYCGLRRALSSGVLAAKLLYSELEDACTVAEPEAAQMNVYGHKLRHLLISACTEVESAWRSVYIANSSDPAARLTTRDYVKLADPMKLREWKVFFNRVSPAMELTPFEAWDANRPTESLPWYDAYNATKHNREEHLDRAQLGHVVNALAGLHVMLLAQFGVELSELLPVHPFHHDDTPDFGVSRYVESPFEDGPWREARLFAGPA